jgi:hypothetical protein
MSILWAVCEWCVGGRREFLQDNGLECCLDVVGI